MSRSVDAVDRTDFPTPVWSGMIQRVVRFNFECFSVGDAPRYPVSDTPVQYLHFAIAAAMFRARDRQS